MPVLLFAFSATLSPGGATTLAMAAGVQFGYFRSVALITGMASGLATLVGASAIGLGSIISAIPQFELWLRILGSGYLLWLAILIARQSAPNEAARLDENPLGYLAGLLLLWANPKAWTMAASAAGSFNQITDSPVSLGISLGAIFWLAAAISLSVWCTGGMWLSTTIQTDVGWRILHIILASLLILSIAMLWR